MKQCFRHFKGTMVIFT